MIIITLLSVFCVALTASAADDSKVIFPSGTSVASVPADPKPSGSNALPLVGVAALAAVGGWLVWRGRKLKVGGRDARQLLIQETRPLGNRQYLVVASYQEKKFLLGVCPGRIDLLAPLHEPTEGRESSL